MNPKLWWYLARAGGLVAWALSAASILWGLLLSTRLLKRRPAPGWLLDLHRFLGGATVAFTGIHAGALVADSFVHFGAADLLIPFASDWRPGAVAWGIVAMYLLVAIQASSLAMRRLPRRLWKTVHTMSYVVFATGTIHGLVAGTEASNRATQWSMLVVAAVVLFLVIVRVLSPRATARTRHARPGPEAATPVSSS